MAFLRSHCGLFCAVAVIGACSSSVNPPATGTASGQSTSGSTAIPGTGSGSGSAVASGTGAGVSGSDTSGNGANAQSGTSGVGGPGSGSVSTGATGSAGASSGVSGSAGAAGSAGASTGGAGTSGSASTSATTGSSSGTTSADAGGNYPPPPRPINVTGGGVFSQSYMGQPMYVDKSKPIQGKLVLLLGGICTGTGAGGFESFIEQYGFHVFGPKTDTCLDGGKVPQSYVTTLKTTPNDPEANRQIGDSRMELWDGKPRVNWYSVAPGASIVEETQAAIKYGMMVDPGGDWGYFLNPSDGSLRTSDVWVVGYSWGSQTWAMISAYVPFDRVITTSGPQSEGFPNALWITQPDPNGTPGNRKYMLVGFQSAYPSTYAADSEVMSMVATVTKGGWIGPPTNVTPTSTGPYMAPQHLFAMIGGNGGTTPGGHTVFCNNNPMNGWLPLCKYVVNVQ